MTQDTQEARVVVGDRFEEFLANRDTVAATELAARLRAGEVPPGAVVVVGQGLTAEQRDELATLAARSEPPVRLTGGDARAAGRHLTHKHDPRNAMVATPERVAEDRFVADLVVDERTEMLADHLTGQHIPGIALTEAARQMWTAVTERFLLGEDPAPVRFVLATVDSTFHRYVFPLPTTVEYVLLHRAETAMERVFRCRVEVRQNDAVAAEVTAEYRVIPERLNAKQEAMAARAAVRAELARHTPAPAGAATG